MRLQENDEGPQEVGTMEAVKAKVLVQREAGDLKAVRVELSSENDLFYHYTHQVDEASFRTIQEDQKLMIDFIDYPSVLVRQFNAAIKEPDV